MLYARRSGWALEGIEVDIRQELPSGKGRDRIEMALSFGGELTSEQEARLREASQRCPVHRMLAGGVEIIAR